MSNVNLSEKCFEIQVDGHFEMCGAILAYCDSRDSD